MKDKTHFSNYFNLWSFMPLLLFILGFYTIYLLVLEQFSQAFFNMLISVLVYVFNNMLIHYSKITTYFNEFLEDMASFLAFGISSMVFGIIFFSDSELFLAIILFYGVALVLSLARNWVLEHKNSVGFPLVLGGLFLPFLYYIYLFYLQDMGSSIFLLYFLITGLLFLSKVDFISSKNPTILDSMHLQKNFHSVGTTRYDEDLGLEIIGNGAKPKSEEIVR